MAFLVRRAGRRDLADIQRMWEELRQTVAKQDARFRAARNAARQVAEHREVILADPRTAFFVAEEQGALIGFLHAQIEPNDPVYTPERVGTVVDVFVMEDRRRQGIGRMLLSRCREWFDSHNLAEFRVTLPVASEGARRFFERAGTEALQVVHSARIGES